MCTRPMVMAWNGHSYTVNGKKKYCFPTHFTFDRTPGSFEKIKNDLFSRGFVEVGLCSCGQCFECRMQYSREWANRCFIEGLYHSDNYFVTLTYDDEHLPAEPRVDRTTGEYLGGLSASVSVDDHKKFVKRLRMQMERKYGYTDKISYYMCAEYGDRSWRPHYHYIFFGLPIPDLEFDCKGRGDYLYYSSDFLQKEVWKKGIVRICRANWETCAYVARYMTKKQKGSTRDFYDKNGINKVFSCCSSKPAIARQYYDENKDTIYEFDKIIVCSRNGTPMKIKPFYYYDKLFDLENPELLDSIKKDRQALVELSQQDKLSRTSLSLEDYLVNVRENNNKLISAKLPRSL